MFLKLLWNQLWKQQIWFKPIFFNWIILMPSGYILTKVFPIWGDCSLLKFPGNHLSSVLFWNKTRLRIDHSILWLRRMVPEERGRRAGEGQPRCLFNWSLYIMHYHQLFCRKTSWRQTPEGTIILEVFMGKNEPTWSSISSVLLCDSF